MIKFDIPFVWYKIFSLSRIFQRTTSRKTISVCNFFFLKSSLRIQLSRKRSFSISFNLRSRNKPPPARFQYYRIEKVLKPADLSLQYPGHVGYGPVWEFLRYCSSLLVPSAVYAENEEKTWEKGQKKGRVGDGR